MERWIVISNCQTHGLTNCLSLQNPGAEVEACDIWRFRHESGKWVDEIGSYDRIFLTDEILNQGIVDFSGFNNVLRVPDIEFGGYHPDLCYVWHGDDLIKSPLDDCHSVICLAAFKKGLSERDTRALFRADIYEAGGYPEIWALERSRLFQRFASYDFDMSAEFRRWSMRENFMYSLNHPRIDCLYDIAAEASRRVGHTPVLNPLRPHDNLVTGPIFPVYDELAEQYGIDGSYAFKPMGQYRVLDLEQFIAGSFAAYRQCSVDQLKTTGIFEPRYHAIFNAI